MDFLDVLITVVIIAVVLLGNVSKLRKKFPSSSQTTELGEDDWEGEVLSSEGESYEKKWRSQNEKIETNSSKSESYFTYETVSDPNVQLETSAMSSLQKTNEIHIQEVENETETADLDLQNPEELKKAILYGEILKNPYN